MKRLNKWDWEVIGQFGCIIGIIIFVIAGIALEILLRVEIIRFLTSLIK